MSEKRCATCWHFHQNRDGSYCGSRSHFGKFVRVAAYEWCEYWAAKDVIGFNTLEDADMAHEALAAMPKGSRDDLERD